MYTNIGTHTFLIYIVFEINRQVEFPLYKTIVVFLEGQHGIFFLLDCNYPRMHGSASEKICRVDTMCSLAQGQTHVLLLNLK